MNESESAAHPDWTPLQEAYIRKLFATYQANLYFLRERFPSVFDTLMASKLRAPFEIHADGSMTIFSGQHAGSVRDFTDLGRVLLHEFERATDGTRVWVEAGYLEKPAEITDYASNPDFFRPVEHVFRGEIVRRFKERCPTPEHRHRRPVFGDHVQPLVIVFGSGFGWHLERLVDEYEIFHLFIVDTDVERLNMSLYFVDFIALHQRFERHGRSFSIALHDDNELLAASVLATIQKHAAPYMVQGAALFFHDYDSDRVRDLWERISADMGKLFRGWGFFDDEVLGLRHAVENALARRPVYVGGASVPADAVAVVVGAGPSLDVLLPVLRNCRERVVVFSCGTAISALANAGIDPDFHVEIERTAATYRILDTPRTRAVLARTPLLTSAIMYPGVFDLSPQPAMFLKDIDFGSNMLDFDRRLPRIRTNPTCTNGGLDFALKMGFRKVFLFGVDLGFHPDGAHHSKNSIYYNGEAKEGYLAGVVAGTHRLHHSGKPVPGNFCDTVLSTDQLTYSRDILQVSIAAHPDAVVYNPNDGARIAWTERIRPDDIRVEATLESRQQAIAAVNRAFMRGVLDDMPANIANLVAQLDAVIADLRMLFARPLRRKADLFVRLADMHAYLFETKHQESQVFPLVRGSMQHMGRFANDCFALMKDEAAAIEYGREVFELFVDFLNAGRENLVALHALASTGKLPEQAEG
ncbi:hypothetical protein GCM10025771_28900 [Niveibacterium umoris]|uniref:DUF115 domain-containing protein n=1 Tax=Niveibacterium umoris TaxID=1193620 RepID=A0A840BN68_9RHOO|nr:6-hydroxymethylpterin diphosphokinase MptE-like protein [Niveibacterium umoris]MBB4011917.1 hypothetical protein [Niveibacterium umoris]